MIVEGRVKKIIQLINQEEVNKSNEELVLLKASRRAKISLLDNQICGSVKQCLNAERSEESIEQCGTLLEKVCEIEQEVKNLNFRIKRLIVDEAQLGEELSETFNMTLKTKKLRMKLKNFMEQKPVHEQQRMTTNPKTGVKLPKFMLKKFIGDSLEWKTFQEIYEAAIGQNESLSEVEKFTYLRGYLQGTVFQAIEGFSLTSGNDRHAWELLKERYGNPQLIISCHVNNLIKLDKVNGANAKELRDFYDKIESNVTALKTVEIHQEQVGSLLIPIVLEKLPNVIKLQNSCKLGKENWSIDDFLICINTEITVRESYKFMKHDVNEGTPNKPSFSGGTSFANSNPKKCVFCQSIDHYSDKCIVVTEIDKRRELLKRNRLSFNCLSVRPKFIIRQRLGLDINISTKYVYVTKHTHTARMKKTQKSCFCECNEN